MSSANFSRNKWVNALINITSSMIVVLFTVYLTTSDLDAREIRKDVNEKASTDELDEAKKEAKKYTDKTAENLRIQMQIKINGIENGLEDVKDSQVRTEGYLIEILKMLPKN